MSFQSFVNWDRIKLFLVPRRAVKKIIGSGLAFAVSQAMVFFIYAAALRFGCYLVEIGDMSAMAVMGWEQNACQLV